MRSPQFFRQPVIRVDERMPCKAVQQLSEAVPEHKELAKGKNPPQIQQEKPDGASPFHRTALNGMRSPRVNKHTGGYAERPEEKGKEKPAALLASCKPYRCGCTFFLLFFPLLSEEAKCIVCC